MTGSAMRLHRASALRRSLALLGMTLAAYAFTDGRCADAGEPRGDIGVGGIQRLADLVAEIEPAVQQDVRQREALAAQVFLARHLPVEPLQPVGRDHLEAGRGFGRAGDPLLEEFQAFAEAIAVGERLADVEIDAPRPHPALGAFFRRRSDHRRLRIFLLEIFADRGDLRQIAAVVEFERRHLAVRIALEMLGLPIFAAAQVDGLLGHLDALLRHEHADNARIRPDRVVELHGSFPPSFVVASLLTAFEQPWRRTGLVKPMVGAARLPQALAGSRPARPRRVGQNRPETS